MTALVRVTHRYRGEATGADFSTVLWINPAYIVSIADLRGRTGDDRVASIHMDGRRGLIYVDEPDLAAVLAAFPVA